MKPSQLPDPRGIVAVDTETSGLFTDDGVRVSTVSVAWIPEAIVQDEAALVRAIRTGEGVVSHAFPFDQGMRGKPEDDGVDTLFSLDDPNLGEDEWISLLQWLLDAGVEYGLVMHNAPFDLEKMRVGVREELGWLNPTGVDYEPWVIWDTQIVCKELDPTEPTSLKPTAERRWSQWSGDLRKDEKAIKTWLKEFCKRTKRKISEYGGRYDLIPWDVLGPYAAMDTELTIRLMFEQMLRYEDGEGDRLDREREFQVMRILKRMTQRGLPYPVGKSLDVVDVLMGRRDAIDLPFRPTDQGAKKWFFGDMQSAIREVGHDVKGLEPYSTTEQGNAQLTAEHVQRIIDDYPGTEAARVAQLWLDWGKLDTAISMWYQGYAEKTGKDGRLRTYFRQTHVRSGRLSVERINLQAIPHDYRLGDFAALAGVPSPRKLIGEAFAEIEGWVPLEMDLAQAELRVAAQKANCQRMLDAIAEGADLHGDATREIMGIDKDSEHWFPYRQAMKRGNFSLIFGVGWAKLAADIRKNTGLILSESEARRLVRDWNALYPEYANAINKFERSADRLGYTRLVNGRMRWYSPIEETHKAFNQYVQGSLAEFGKDWSIFTEDLLARNGVYARAEADGIGGAGLLLTIHDSQVLLLPKEEAVDIAAEISAWVAETASNMFGVPMAADWAYWGEK